MYAIIKTNEMTDGLGLGKYKRGLGKDRRGLGKSKRGLGKHKKGLGKDREGGEIMGGGLIYQYFLKAHCKAVNSPPRIQLVSAPFILVLKF